MLPLVIRQKVLSSIEIISSYSLQQTQMPVLNKPNEITICGRSISPAMPPITPPCVFVCKYVYINDTLQLQRMANVQSLTHVQSISRHRFYY
jgi:hypothetical protein